MLTKNLDVSKGGVNGAIDAVTNFMPDLGGKTSFTVSLFYTIFLFFILVASV